MGKIFSAATLTNDKDAKYSFQFTIDVTRHTTCFNDLRI